MIDSYHLSINEKTWLVINISGDFVYITKIPKNSYNKDKAVKLNTEDKHIIISGILSNLKHGWVGI